jgi:hypothetical protein
VNRYIAVCLDAGMPIVTAHPDLQSVKDALKSRVALMPGSVWYVLDVQTVKARRYVLPQLSAVPDATDTTPA